ncbi:MAG TPA: DUF6010 family protein [Gemmatimonadaceae bacterium]|nr:DUF6010 family protein [Gemmatimonadaceae bacterium]
MDDILSRPEIAVMIGVLGAAILVLIARGVAHRRETLVYGVGLGFTAVVYVVFGLQRGAPASHLGREFVGALPYVVVAVLGTWRWPALLALGWIAHAAWDLHFHYANGPAFAPSWYALFCVGFDVAVGGYIAGLVAARLPAAQAR